MDNKVGRVKSGMNQVKICGKSDTTDVYLIIQTLALLHEEYEVTVSSLKYKVMADSGEVLDLQEVRDKFAIQRDRIKQHDDEQKDGTAFLSTLHSLLRNKRRDRVNVTQDDDDNESAFIEEQAHVFAR